MGASLSEGAVILKGARSVGEFRSVALTAGRQQADTGTKMIHLGKDSRSLIVSKGISAGKSSNGYRGLVKIAPAASGIVSNSQCDSLLLGGTSEAFTLPYLDIRNPTAQVEHEATTSTVGAEQLFYFQSRGMDAEEAVKMIVCGMCDDVFNELPLEFAEEARALLSLGLEGSVG